MEQIYLDQITPFAHDKKHGMLIGKDNHDRTVWALYKLIVTSNGHDYPLTDPEYLKAWYETAPTQTEIDREIMLNDWSRWNLELIEASEPVEVSESVYYQMLECLPPRNWKGNYFEVGEPHHHDRNGKAIHRAFYSEDTPEGTKFYTSYPKTV